MKSFCLFSIEFTIFAEITETTAGFPRLHYEGHTFGRRKLKSDVNSKYYDKEHMRWICTRSDKNKRRCTATIMTKVIDGYVMMREKNLNHICTK